MQVNVNRLTNASIYIDNVNLLGEAEEIKIPGIKAKLAEHKGLGMVGTAEFPSGIDKLEASTKWVSVYENAQILIGSPFEVHALQVRGNVEVYTSSGLTAQLPAVWLMSASVKDRGEFTFKQHDNVDTTTQWTVYHLEQYFGGTLILVYDVLSNTYIVNGIDQLAQFRANLGG